MKRDSVTAHPLCWPDGWSRTPAHARQSDSVFSTRRTDGYGWNSLTFDRARRSLAEELERLKAVGVVLSSNVPLRIDGNPRSGDGDRRLDDPGIAVYFSYKGKPMVMAADRYVSAAGNMRSLALAIEAMRALERHGGGVMMERAFAGFTALPAPEGSRPRRPWWEVLRFPVDPAERELLSPAEVKARYNTLALRLHPDQGGDADAMAELNQARDDAVADLESATS
jgi:hypothetical protein